MFSQYWPGGQSDDPKDSAQKREHAFIHCLDWIVDWVEEMQKDDPTFKPLITFPFLIGCGIAGGNWAKYHAMLLYYDEVLSKLGVTTQLSKFQP